MNWLKKQEVWQRYTVAYRPKIIQSTILKKPYKQIGIDLIDMQNQMYKDNNYILTAIDLFTKKTWAEPLKNKKEKTVAKGMENILKRINHHVSTIHSDHGSEFINAVFKKLLKEHKIKQVLS